MTIAATQPANPVLRHWKTIAFMAVGLLALALRLIFIVEHSDIFIIWDAGLYWDGGRQVQSALCESLTFCDPAFTDYPSFSDSLAFIYNREGILPLIVGVLLLIFPVEPQTTYVFNALLDTFTCLFLMGLTRKLSERWWVALLAGVLFAVYVPAITGSGALLQQPLIRFGLVGAVWAYTMAFSTDRRIWLWIGVGTLFTTLLGYSSITTRPLMLLLFAIVSAVGLFTGKRRILIAQIVLAEVGLVVMTLLALASNPDDTLDMFVRLFTGLSSQGGAADQTTVISFEHFWPPSSWQTVALNPTESVFGDFARAPGDFIANSIYSLFSNLRYADYVYLQQFGLTLPQQNIQHMLYLVTGLGGLMWLAGQRGWRRNTTFLIVISGGFLCVIYSIISVEPRRFSAIMPFFAMGGALFFGHLWPTRSNLTPSEQSPLQQSTNGQGVGAVREPPNLVLWSIITFIIAWLLPLPAIMLLSPLDADTTHTALVLLRAGASLFVVYALVRHWHHKDPTFSRWQAVIPAGLAILVVTIAGFQESMWRFWQANITQPVQQTVTIGEVKPHLHTWLLVDVASPEQAASLMININENTLKPAGTPMFAWEVGIPAVWSPYHTLTEIANFEPTRRRWLATPLPTDFLDAGSLTVELIPGETPITLGGDYVPSDDRYIGASFSPWYDGLSFWRWQWNATDPRIPIVHALRGWRYESAHLDNEAWQTDDLSDAFGQQTGAYRIYIAQVAFGRDTNAFGAPQAENVEQLCTQSSVLMAPRTDGIYTCRRDDGTVEYYVGGVFAGESEAGVFGDFLPQNTIVDEITFADGRIDVIQVLARTFVANIYQDDQLVYSLVFDV